MADAEEPQHFNSLAERIAALNKQPNFTEPKKKPPPPPPSNQQRPSSRTPAQTQAQAQAQATASPPLNGHAQATSPALPARPVKKASPSVLPQRTNTDIVSHGHMPSPPTRGLAPPLPRRDSEQTKTSPALPPRRPSTQSLGPRRGSNESIRSTMSSLSLNNSILSTATSVGSTDGRRLPPPLEQAKLPPLPPSRKEREAAQAQEAEDARAATAAKITLNSGPLCHPGCLTDQPDRPAYWRPRNRLQTFPHDGCPLRPPTSTAPPPPVPLASRPSAAQVDAAASRGAAQQQQASCLICRDFTGPDGVAAQYPPSVIDRGDPIGYLAHHLCGPFPSPTDKARAIFTWCHHNIDYDVAGFFAGCPARGTASETVFSGKAVCEGYARTYEAIAKRAGLECIVVGGHGKGFGFEPVKDGQPPPPRKATGHAWNAVRIDNGHWKLIDPCWGAGHLDGQSYKRAFNPQQFTMSNEIFGWRHFPEDSRYSYRDDRRALSWEEYIMGPTGGERPRWFGSTVEEGISEWNASPPHKEIPVYSGEMVRFQFAKLCEHWTAERNGRGKPRLLMMNIHGVDGRKKDQVPLDSDGFWWWCDIPARDLGSPGQKVQLYGLNVLNGKDAMGVTKQEFQRFCGVGARVRMIA
ncbi:hypothetical protein M406DRAFT_97996 [Cryphonectria parasitica EP155]|uniref:Transglutaminase-like domain-containing protein n=1 Tax=Cryphonectria parasitica (strain ATCC 38755 / EP155) TaxID=660469 RepID=A0A9P4Y793_CRYP1|nr:uncharacterized protein M406DRAFT_97996 [Cryphonectria parasitica EP155]KAF3767729.1 hypothetical protein M406DRAFT_97996 [Cryphonectria parasitica EP155]